LIPATRDLCTSQVEHAYPQYILRRYRRVLPAEGRTWHNHGQAPAAFKSAHTSSPFGAGDVQRVKQTPIAGADTAAGNLTEWPTAFNDPSYYQQWFLVCAKRLRVSLPLKELPVINRFFPRCLRRARGRMAH
jgi:hypothetical protein